MKDDYKELLADRDSWMEQAHQRVKDWDDMRLRAEKAEAAQTAQGQGDGLREWSLRMAEKEDGQYVCAGSHGLTDSASPAEVPDGYVLIPREPTRVILEAMMNEQDSADGEGPREVEMLDIYRAMLAAVPSAPEGDGEVGL